jgi:hypothetical protein
MAGVEGQVEQVARWAVRLVVVGQEARVEKQQQRPKHRVRMVSMMGVARVVEETASQAVRLEAKRVEYCLVIGE